MKRFLSFAAKVIAVALVGIVFAAVGGVIGGFVMRGELFGFGGLAGALIGMLAGYPVGAVVGIVLMRTVLHRHGSILFGAIGSIIGEALPLALAEPLNVNTGVVIAMILLAVPLLGIAGFHLKSRSK